MNPAGIGRGRGFRGSRPALESPSRCGNTGSISRGQRPAWVQPPATHQHEQSIRHQNSHGSSNARGGPSSWRTSEGGAHYFQSGSSAAGGETTMPRPETGGDVSAAVPEKLPADCKILVLGQTQRGYSYAVTTRITGTGLSVNHMFLSGDLLAQELEEILIRCAKSGNIFVVSIDQNNEANQTIDFYQLRGCSKPQHHKNVPLKLACRLIYSKFYEIYEKIVRYTPPEIKMVLEVLSEDGNIRDEDFTNVINFLEHRRMRQLAFSRRAPASTSTSRAN